MTTEDVREQVRQRYAKAASAVSTSPDVNALALVAASQCCAPSVSDSNASCRGGAGEVDAAFGSSLYGADEHGEPPAEATAASLGCGNPMAVADLRAGEKVLDLGSGGGIDVLLSAHRVGATGFACGVDMTAEMLEPARANAVEAGAANVEFRRAQSRTSRSRPPRSTSSSPIVLSTCPPTSPRSSRRCSGS